MVLQLALPGMALISSVMKIISVRQPWASLIVLGFKDVENRSWSTRYRGPVLIHASKRGDQVSKADIECRYGVRLEDNLRLGGIVGLTEIVDCVRPHPSPWYVPGCYGLVLTGSRPTPFIEWKGSLGLRDAPKKLTELLEFYSS